ncbi:MAG: acetate--CoA ligase family protein, partial [Pollutimonas bauzanensis]
MTALIACRVPEQHIKAGPLDEAQAKQLFVRFGIPVTREIVVNTSPEAESAAKEIGGPVALKLLSRQVTHKSDIGGVMLNLDRPLNQAGAASMLRSLKSWPLLDGYRGKPLRDTEAMAAAIVRFSEMVHILGPRLKVAEINPVFIRNQGGGAMAADG